MNKKVRGEEIPVSNTKSKKKRDTYVKKKRNKTLGDYVK